MSELKSGTLSQPVELAYSQLDMIAGGQATAFVKQRNRVHVSIGNDDTVTNGGSGSVSVGSTDMAINTQSNSNSGSVTATHTAS